LRIIKKKIWARYEQWLCTEQWDYFSLYLMIIIQLFFLKKRKKKGRIPLVLVGSACRFSTGNLILDVCFDRNLNHHKLFDK